MGRFSLAAIPRLVQGRRRPAGYTICADLDGKGDTAFGLTVSRVHSVEQETADAVVMELFRLAKQFDGEYDGWETPIVTQ